MSKIKLTGESSGYVEISAGSNAGNNTLELPTSGTRLIASDSDGNVTIGGTLTYADVTNVDSVGVITARSGLHVTGGSVGIGTDNPITKLVVNSGTTNLATQIVSDDAEVFLAFKDGDSTGNQQVQIGGVGNNFVAYAGGNERLRVFSDGTIGIGSITSTTPVIPPTDDLDGTAPGLSPVKKYIGMTHMFLLEHQLVF